MNDEIKRLIDAADKAIKEERFDDLMEFYTDDAVLVLSQTLLEADNKSESEYSMDRRATYVYRNVNGKWLCSIDNSYGTTLLD